MAAIRRVLSSSCRGLIVVLLAALVGLAMPAVATITHGDGSSEPASASLSGTHLTWVGADGSMQSAAPAETSHPVNPVAIADAHRAGFDGAAGTLAFAGTLLAFGMALVAVRRRD